MIEILKPGALTTWQGPPLWNQAHLGISAGGPADPESWAIAHHLTGAPPNSPALEITLLGPTLKFLSDCYFALTGAPFTAHLDGEPITLWTPHPARAGQILRIGSTPLGVRCYLSLGHQPASHNGPIPQFATNYTLRVTPGPQYDWFPSRELPAYAVTQDSNRRGIRLTGPPLTQAIPRELITEGVTAGAVQIPPSGEPVILFIDQQTTGGYPKIAHVITADLPILGRLRPGDTVTMRWVDLD
jgi:allophanate hydrolase subunit 2